MLLRDLVDAHVHADGLRDPDLETLAAFGVERVVVCAHDGGVQAQGGEITAKAWLNHWERLLTTEQTRLKRAGLRPVFALGVHPAHAPWHGLEELLHKLPGFLSDPAAVAIGSLGLKRNDERERHVLARQIELASDLRRPVYVSAPPLGEARGLRQLAATMRGFEFPPERVLVGQVTVGMVPLLRACGFTLALEPSEGRLSTTDIVALVRRHGSERFVLTSHAGEGPADFLAVPALAAHLLDAGLSAAVVERVARDNALRFLGREDAVVRRARAV
jgi:predicted metal-dependent TIM-barrel fold hydrolase